MKVVPLFCYNSLRNFTYIIIGIDQVVCVDPFDSDIVIRYLDDHNLELSAILNTHGHHDHIRGNDDLLQKTNATLITLKNEMSYKLSDFEELVAFDTPGHTMDHQCFLGIEKKETKFILVGDTLFNAGLGNCKNGGDKKTLYQSSLRMMKYFPDKAIIYPGHDYFKNNLDFAKSVTLLNEKQNQYLKANIKAENGSFPFLTFKEIKDINPFLQVSSEREFLDLRNKRDNW